MLYKITVCLLAFSTCARCALTPTESYRHHATLRSGNIKLYWKFDDTRITFEVHGKTKGWIGIGWSPNGAMTNADIIVGWVKNGQVKVTDRHGASYNTFPPLDDEQNIDVITGREENGWTMFKFSRSLGACEDGADREISADTQRLIYAWGDSDPAGDDMMPQDYHGTQDRGVESMFFLEAAEKPTEALPLGPTYHTFDIRSDKFRVPAEKTYYNCRLFKLPKLTKKHHAVKFEPIIQKGSELNVHHMILYQCAHEMKNQSELGLNERCFSPNMQHFATCNVIIAEWAVGAGASLYPDVAGLSLGGPDDPVYVQLETHYDNPTAASNIVDSSGLRMTYTSTLRKYDVGVLNVGNIVDFTQHFIPPKAESFLSVGFCHAGCLQNRMSASGVSNLTAFNVVLHSHTAGRKLRLRHFRNGSELPYLASDNSYDFNYQEGRYLLPHVTIQPEDTLRMECVYNTMGRTQMTQGALGTKDEMCMSFISYYPKIDLSVCVSVATSYQSWAYFGIQNVAPIQPAIGLQKFNVTAPESLAGKTVLDVMSEFNWNETTVDQFSDALLRMTQIGYCLVANNSEAKIYPFQTPRITNEYVPPKKACVMSGASTVRPPSTTARRADTTNAAAELKPTTVASIVSSTFAFLVLLRIHRER